MNKSIVCFGEALWDVLPTGKQPGGAPFNVAVHLHQLGQPALLISRVGHDDLGTELLDFLNTRGLDTHYVQRGETHLTGVVKANVGDRNEVVYKIVQPVAWDYIQYEEALAELVAKTSMLVFGSLAARTNATRETLYRLLPNARFRVFDVNMRAPHYTREVVQYLLQHADLVKMNQHELAEILGWYGQDADDDEALGWLADRFHLQSVCVTLGADGALLWKKGRYYRSEGIAVTVQDTIGSGDAFLAGLLLGWQAGHPPQECLRFACAAGSVVATYQGATPAITPKQVADLLAEQVA
ncbi:MAG: carbohydrate kinase [Hymenobacter sp.]|nr:MAG: carbohydrate kinase [Hymenobacter sp.]